MALQHNITLVSLELGYNSIDDEGATALGVALQHNTTLTHLPLWKNPIGNAMLASISNALDRNKLTFFNQYWSPCLHVDFPQQCHELIIASLLSNRSTDSCPALPDHVWHLIYSFFMRKNLEKFSN